MSFENVIFNNGTVFQPLAVSKVNYLFPHSTSFSTWTFKGSTPKTFSLSEITEIICPPHPS